MSSRYSTILRLTARRNHKKVLTEVERVWEWIQREKAREESKVIAMSKGEYNG